MQKTSLKLGLLALIGVISPCSIHAAPPPNVDIDTDMMAREYRETTNGPGALTREMIEACVVLRIDMEKNATNLANLRKELGKLNNEVKDLGAYLKNNKGQFDENDNSAVRTAYQAKVKKYNSRIPILKKKTQKYQDMIKPYKGKEGKFEQECNNQPYYEDDYKAIEKKMGRGL
jgi:predicted  nucleic acid-binding Zn-ribbon protein